jgi:2-methylcitrate dehydratase
VQQLARFVSKAAFEDLSESAVRQLKIRILDALGCAIGALNAEPIQMLHAQLEDFGGNAHCTLIGGGKTAPDLAAFYNGALVRYLDFNDAYLAKGETCHPNDNVAPVLAASEYAKAPGRDFLAALAVAYQVQCRLSDAAPVRSKGFDHTTQGSYAIAAGVSKALGLDGGKIANAIAISGTALNALRVTRTGTLSHWKGLAYPYTAFGATHIAFLTMRGITGPPEVFEGNKGFMDSIAGRFEINWSAENLERVNRTVLKRYNAEIHSQSTIEAILELTAEAKFTPDEIDKIEIQIFDVAYNIIGGGEEGNKTNVRTKEQADHSLQYITAVAILDGQVMPEQYSPSRIVRDDVQKLLRKILVLPNQDFSKRFPEQMPCLLKVYLKDGRILEKEKNDYEGFFTRPMTWERAAEKFARLTTLHVNEELREEIITTVAGLEDSSATDLTELLEVIPRNKQKV